MPKFLFINNYYSTLIWRIANRFFPSLLKTATINRRIRLCNFTLVLLYFWFCDLITLHHPHQYRHLVSVCGATDTPTYVPLGDNCTANSECAGEALCDEHGTCVCPLGYLPLKDGVNCDQFYCETKAECEETFSMHTDCIGNGCFCETGYELDGNATGCLLASQLIGSTCRSSTECGDEAVCIQVGLGKFSTVFSDFLIQKGVCKCKFGKVTDNGQDCSLFKCQNDGECKKLDPNSHCTGLHCICDSGRYLDVELQICSKSSWKYIYILAFVVEVFSIIFVY